MNGSPAKVYCVNFSLIGTAGVNLAAFAQYLYDSADIIAFWNYLPAVYCVKSHLTATVLARKFDPFFPDGNFLVAEINVSNLDGRLPEEAWRWFYLDHHQKTHAPYVPPTINLLTTSSSDILGLLGIPPPPPKRP